MAREAFSDDAVIAALQDFIPVLVDGDVEKDACATFRVDGYPDTRFLDAAGKELGAVGGYVGAAEFLQQVKAARARLPKTIPLTPAYQKLLKSRQAMDKAFGKQDYAAAMTAVLAIEKTKREGRDARAAARVREQVAAAAQEQLAVAEALASEGKLKEAADAFQKAARSFKDLPEGKDAARRADEVRKQLAPPAAQK